MLGELRTRLTYANVASTICLFIVLGGGAYAAATLPRNSVGAKQLKKNAVNSSKIRDSSLLARDFKTGQLPADARGPAGEPGPPGTVRAYGLVTSTGALDPAQSNNLTVAKITSPSGAYCVRPAAGSGIDPNKVDPVVTADFADGSGSAHIAQISTSTYHPAECPATAGWEIYTQIQAVGGEFNPGDVAFSILVP